MSVSLQTPAEPLSADEGPVPTIIRRHLRKLPRSRGVESGSWGFRAKIRDTGSNQGLEVRRSPDKEGQ
jgi:hypothetical protein